MDGYQRNTSQYQARQLKMGTYCLRRMLIRHVNTKVRKKRLLVSNRDSSGIRLELSSRDVVKYNGAKLRSASFKPETMQRP